EREALEAAVLLLAPVVPHITQALWRHLGHGESLVDAPWPIAAPEALEADRLTLAVQVNGKVRAQLDVAADADREAIEGLALAESNVLRFTEGKAIRKVILVPKRLVNIVTD